jgi:hypothetical protein
MKSKISLFILFLSICGLFGCMKEEIICENPPEGIYEGWFTNTVSDYTHRNLFLYLSIIDDKTFKISPIPNSTSNYTLIRENCKLKGKMGARIGSQGEVLNIDGEIMHEDRIYIIKGNYTYQSYSGGLGNPNGHWVEVSGSFIIKQKI